MFARVKKSGKYQYLQIVENNKKKGLDDLLLPAQEIGAVLRRCEFIRTWPNEFGPTILVGCGEQSEPHQSRITPTPTP